MRAPTYNPLAESAQATLSREQAGAQHDARMTRLREGLNEVTEICRDNIGKVLDRGEKLEALEDRSRRLAEASRVFHVQTRRVRRAEMWRKVKQVGAIVLGVTLVIGVIVLVVAL